MRRQNLIETKEGAKALATIKRLVNIYNHDNSDIMTDYFDVNYYTQIEVSNEYQKI